MVCRNICFVALVIIGVTYQCEGWFFRKRRYYDVSASGRFTCGGTPIADARVYIKDRELVGIYGKTIASGWTDANGGFSLSGRGRDVFDGKPDVYVQLDYNYQDKMMVKDRISSTRRYKSSWKKNFSGAFNIGTVNLNDEHCKAYNHFRNAVRDFISRAGRPLPRSSVYVVTNALIHGGTPWAMTQRIRIPSGYSLTGNTAKHELAHIARHTLDGSAAHFLVDVARYGYARNHNLYMSTNEGFAFNEGWAEYWAGDCSYTSGDGTDMKIEGNVAAALCKLAKCKGHPAMWKTLEANRGRIHSYNDFVQRMGNC
ncbi:unnamed protein product [Owenia fusiformis]|uniref:Uncharacterized protein n=1 Tax=Owenia fusiformis TaxID=6347 RepID=A0A8J1YD35_OWEFU|nr:unnamed protein product [Owenia fusiformis]